MVIHREDFHPAYGAEPVARPPRRQGPTKTGVADDPDGIAVRAERQHAVPLGSAGVKRFGLADVVRVPGDRRVHALAE